jgi:magnesium-transporting ATPase (P-type)
MGEAAAVAATMAFTTFVFYQAFNLLNVRHDTRSVFSRETLNNHTAFIATAAVIVLLVAVVERGALHQVFTTTDLASGQWLICAAVGSTIPVGGRTGQNSDPCPRAQFSPRRSRLHGRDRLSQQGDPEGRRDDL